MLEDRDYMRAPQSRWTMRWSATVLLLVALVAAFLLQNIAYRCFPHFSTDDCFALSLDGLKQGHVWQLLSFQFMHAGVLHLLLNCWAIYVFGREVEAALGMRNFLVLYFASGVFGGLLQMAGALAWPGHLGGAVVGASAGAFGLVAAFAMLYPERSLMLLLFFIIPISIRAKFLLLFSAVLAVFGILFPYDNIANAAHLGGMFVGIIFVRYIVHWNWRMPQMYQPFRPGQLRRKFAGAASQKPALWKSSAMPPEEDLSSEEFLSREVDPILDKISAHGIQSLTERERKILEAARAKMAKR